MTFKNPGIISVGTSEGDVIEAPAGVQLGVKVSVSNTANAARLLTLRMFDYSAGTTTTFFAKSIDANSASPDPFVFTLEPGDKLTALGDNTGLRLAVAAADIDTTGGSSALVPKGIYSSGTTYAVNEVTTEAGTSYVSLQNNNLNHAPASSPSWWMVLAEKGEPGDPGADGADGTGSGDVVGPASATDGRPALFDGGTGKLLKQASAALGTAAFLAIDTDVTLAANSDTRIATQKAVKAYADALIAATDAMVFKGVINCSTNPNYPAADCGWTYRVSIAGKIGGASGVNVEAGDLLICLTDSTSSGNHATVGSSWNISQVNLDGAVIGPASATDSHFAQFDTTSGKLLKGGIALDTDGTLAANSDTKLASQKAVKTYIDTTVPVKAAGSDVRTGTNDAKFLTAKALADSAARQTLTDASTVAWDMSLGYNAKFTFVANNRTLGTPTGCIEGITYCLDIIQPASGGPFTLTLPSSSIFDFGAEGAPTLSTGANKRDAIYARCVSTSGPVFECSFKKAS